MSNWHAVSSSHLARIRYQESSRTLEVEFRDGSVYQYFDVPESEFRGLLSATESHGKYFHEHIRENYRYARL